MSYTAGGPTTAYFAVDESALTKGLGNIRKWLESDDIDVVLWIPSYTIRELDFLKKGLTMTAINARESIRLIDKVVSSEDPRIARKVSLELPEEAGPKWKNCMRYKARAPRVHEFPKAQKSNATTISVTMSETEAAQLEEKEEAKSNAAENPDERAELPGRLRFLLRPLIQKAHIDHQNWLFVTEDQTTRIWCESFRIPCINVSEADGLLFQARRAAMDPMSLDLEKMNIGVPAQSQESSGKRRSRRGKKPNQSSAIPGARPGTKLGSHEVKIEKFDKIEFAPRGKGNLWVP